MNRATEPLDRPPARLKLGDRELDLGAGTLRSADGTPVELRPQVWAVLELLARNAGRLVTKDELLAAVWPGLIVTEGSISQAISDLRSALGDAGHQVIKTVPKRGYMLVAGVAEPSPATSEALEPAPPPCPSVAVLAFGDPTGEPAGRQLARGLAQELVAELARNVGLRVVSHHSSFALTDSATPLAEIGRQLRCRWLVDGSVRRDSDALHVTVELIDAEAGDVAWSMRRTAGSSDVLAQRDALVERIAGTVLARVIHERDRTALIRPPKTLDVYAMTLRGIALRAEFHAQATREGRALLERAVAIDPEYGPAWSALGALNAADIIMRYTGEWTARHAAEAAAQAERGIALGFEGADAFVALSIARQAQRLFLEALTAAEHAVELGPSHFQAWHWVSLMEFCLGRCAAALASAERALNLNPVPAAFTLLSYAAALWGNRRHDDAIRVVGETLVKRPGMWPARIHRMVPLYESGRLDEARQEGAALLAAAPHLTAQTIADFADDEAVELRERLIAAAHACGIPPGQQGRP